MSTPHLYDDTKAVVIDLDGTLYHKRGLKWRMLCARPGDIRLLVIERRTRRRLQGQWWGSADDFRRVFFDTMHRQCRFRVSFLQWWHATCYMPTMVRIIRQHQAIRPWVRAFLMECQQASVPVVVLSDYGSTQDKLTAIGLNPELFAAVLSAPDLGGLKPAPELLDTVARQLHVQPGECLVIGDRKDTDGAMAKAFGARFILV